MICSAIESSLESHAKGASDSVNNRSIGIRLATAIPDFELSILALTLK